MTIWIRSSARLILNLLVVGFVLTGCDQEPVPVSADNTPLIGIWEKGRFGENTNYWYLQISASGYFSYARFEASGNKTTCVFVEKTPIKAMTESQITVPLLWFFDNNFEINELPAVFDEVMQVTIEGNVYTKTDNRQDGFDFTWSCGGNGDGGLARRRV